MIWFQALPPELCAAVGLPVPTSPDAVLVSESGLEISRQFDRFYLSKGGNLVEGLNAPTITALLEAHEVLDQGPGAREALQYPLWVVYECNSPQAAETWRQVLLSRAFEDSGDGHIRRNSVQRQGSFVMALIKGRVNSRLLRKSAPNGVYSKLVNWSNPQFVPDGEARFAPQGTPSQLSQGTFLTTALKAAHAKAQGFFHEITGYAGSQNDGPLDPTSVDKIRMDAGWDVSGFKRLGVALNDPLFLAGVEHHGNIRARLRKFLRHSNNRSDLGAVMGSPKTAGEIRQIFHSLIKDYETDAPEHFQVLGAAVTAVSHELPNVGRSPQSLKTWHNSVSGVLNGATNTTQAKLTAKWVIILSIVAAHNPDLTPVHHAVTPDDIFFYVLYGGPTQAQAAMKKAGIALESNAIPAYPKSAFDDPNWRKPIEEALATVTLHPEFSADWEENFLARVRASQPAPPVAP